LNTFWISKLNVFDKHQQFESFFCMVFINNHKLLSLKWSHSSVSHSTTHEHKQLSNHWCSPVVFDREFTTKYLK
jgi:hypothetical protein